MKLGRSASTVLAFAALAAVLSGCVVFKGPVEAKQAGKKKVKVTFSLCNSDGEADSTCPDLGNSESDQGGAVSSPEEEVLLGFRVPKRTKAPETIAPQEKGVVGEFSLNADYAERLNAEAPKRRRFKWIGYSAPPYGDDGGNDTVRYEEASFKVKLKAPKRLIGKKFRFRPVVGWHDRADSPDGSITCGPALYDRVSDADGDRVCIDSPDPETVAKSIKVKLKKK